MPLALEPRGDPTLHGSLLRALLCGLPGVLPGIAVWTELPVPLAVMGVCQVVFVGLGAARLAEDLCRRDGPLRLLALAGLLGLVQILVFAWSMGLAFGWKELHDTLAFLVVQRLDQLLVISAAMTVFPLLGVLRWRGVAVPVQVLVVAPVLTVFCASLGLPFSPRSGLLLGASPPVLLALGVALETRLCGAPPRGRVCPPGGNGRFLGLVVAALLAGALCYEGQRVPAGCLGTVGAGLWLAVGLGAWRPDLWLADLPGPEYTAGGVPSSAQERPDRE